MGLGCFQKIKKKDKSSDITINSKSPQNSISNTFTINNNINNIPKDLDNSQENNSNSFQKNNENEKKENMNICDLALEQHNIYRKKYGTKELQLNPKLSELAQNFADKYAEIESMDHFPYLYNGNIISQNIKELNNEKIDIKKICKEWYDVFKNNNQQQNNNSKFMGIHGKHMLWKDTNEVGFGLSTSPNGKSYFVACYYPAGNI